MPLGKEGVVMKIGYIADLHIDYLKKHSLELFIETFHQVLKDKKIDLVIIGGDVTNQYQLTLDFINQLSKLIQPIQLAFIPGNHDYWQENPTIKETWRIHQLFKEHPLSLMNQSIQINNDIAIVGHMGWYNHAYYRKDRFTPEEVERGKFKIATWQDKSRIAWGLSDQQVSKRFKEELKQLMLAVSAKQIILVTHVVTTPVYIVPMPHRAFDFFNAYMATDDLNELYRNYPIRYSLMGHIHFRHHHQKAGIHWAVSSLGYEKQWRSNSIKKEISDSLFIIDV